MLWWTSKRAMQKKVAQELGLDHETLAMFEEQDGEDDFNGVDLSSRDVIRSAATVIFRTLMKSRFMMIFINGSQDEIVLGRLGITENSDCIILWTTYILVLFFNRDRLWSSIFLFSSHHLFFVLFFEIVHR